MSKGALNAVRGGILTFVEKGYHKNWHSQPESANFRLDIL